MTTKDEALALALQALKPRPGMPNPEYQSLMECAIEAIEEVQSRPEQEPVAWELAEKVRADLDRQSCPGFYMNLAMESIVKHYTSPPQRQLLTEEQLMIEMVDAAMVATKEIVPRITRSQCRLIIEAAHGIGEK